MNLKEELTSILLKLFQKIAEDHFQIHSMRPTSPWYQNQTKTTQKRKLQANITDEHRCKNPQQNFSKQNSATHQKTHIPWSSGVYHEDARIFVAHHIKKLKDRNQITNSIDSEKAFNKILHPFIIKTLQRTGIEGTYLNIIKAIYDKPTANIILYGKKLKAFSLRSGTRKQCSLSPLYST